MNMRTDFINCSSLFSRLVTKLASEGQRQQFCQLPPPPVQVSLHFWDLENDYKQKQIPIKMGNISLYEYDQIKRFCKILESLFLDLLNKLLTSSLPEKIYESFQILKYNARGSLVV